MAHREGTLAVTIGPKVGARRDIAHVRVSEHDIHGEVLRKAHLAATRDEPPVGILNLEPPARRCPTRRDIEVRLIPGEPEGAVGFEARSVPISA